ncbi:hypothetical protein ACFL96_14925 [Thermoproteota archaeon]
MIIFAGITSLLIWLLVTLISRGIPVAFCQQIASVLPKALEPFIAKMQNGFYYDVSNSLMPAEIFFFLFSLAFVIYSFVILNLRKSAGKRNYIFLIVLFGILFRLVLIPSELIHENDIYRYVWDGKVLLSGVNPYKYAPQQAEIKPDQEGDIEEVKKLKALVKEDYTAFRRIGWPMVPTIYPPAAQVMFASSNLIKRGSIPAMKSIFVFFDVLTIFVIYLLLKHFNMNPNMAVVYAWSPLVLKEFANSGHYDTSAIFFLMLSLLFIFMKKISISSISLSLGVLFKFFPIVALPILIKRIKRKHLLVITGLISLGYIPFFLWGRIKPLQLFDGLITYSKEWAINGAIFDAAYSLFNLLEINISFDSVVAIKIMLGLIYLAIIFLFSIKKDISDLGILKRVFWAVALLFLFSPVGDSWYFCWVVPFLCFFPRKSFIMLSWLLIFSYISFSRELGEFAIGKFPIDYLIVIQYLPFYLLLFVESIFGRKRVGVSVSQ